nr:hypothetical protein GCM10025699_10000 [Microbacterium flavescens]
MQFVSPRFTNSRGDLIRLGDGHRCAPYPAAVRYIRDPNSERHCTSPEKRSMELSGISGWFAAAGPTLSPPRNHQSQLALESPI